MYTSSDEKVNEPFRRNRGNFGYSHMRYGGVGLSFSRGAHGRATSGHMNFPQHGVESTSSHLNPPVLRIWDLRRTKTPRLLGVKFVRLHALVWKFLRNTRMESNIRET